MQHILSTSEHSLKYLFISYRKYVLGYLILTP